MVTTTWKQLPVTPCFAQIVHIKNISAPINYLGHGNKK